MKLSDLDFPYPPELVATEPKRPSRVAFVAAGQPPKELSLENLLLQVKPGDLLVVNESKVIPARVFTSTEVEILFLTALDKDRWQVLFPAREFEVGETLALPGGVTLMLEQKGIPQTVRVSAPLVDDYFQKHGEVALPPYIQEAREERHNRPGDREFYQTAWAQHPGSVAAPTASLHFSNADLEWLAARGVSVRKLTLHVGAGTFLPVRTENLDQHEMHAESVRIPKSTLEAVEATKKRGGRVWALGTTVARALEAWSLGEFAHDGEGDASGATKLFIRPGHEFKIVDGLLTNFHQPRSTLISLVGAFAGLDNVKSAYAWAIENKFRLFSYGDLSVWTR